MILTEQSIANMKEDDLRRDVIVPLMKAMGYHGVFEWHGGAGELGKDIVGWKENDLGSRRNKVVVAKADRISGAGAVGEVTTQVRQSFNTGFTDPVTGEHESIHECWIVSNKRLGKEARAAIRAATDASMNPQIEIIGGEELWDLARRYLNVDLQQVLAEAQEQIEAINSPYGIDIHLPAEGMPFATFEARGTRVAITEKYPGQLEQEPLTIGATFSFPDTPEGQAKLREFERSMQTGEAADIPGEFVQIDFPDAVNNLSQQLLGSNLGELETLHISSARSPKRVPVRINVKCDDGDEATLDYIDLQVVQAGTHQITMTNDDQSIPIRIVYVVDTQIRRINLKVSFKSGAIAAPVLLRVLRFILAMCKPCDLRITLVDSDLPVGTLRRNEGINPQIDPQWVTLAEMLAKVQDKFRVPIMVPDTEFNDEDWAAIRQLDELLQSNERYGTWTEMRLVVPASQAPGLIETWRNEPTETFVLEQSLTLFGSALPLGKVYHSVESLRVDNDAEVLEALANGSVDDDIELIVVPAGSNRIRMLYEDGQPPSS